MHHLKSFRIISALVFLISVGGCMGNDGPTPPMDYSEVQIDDATDSQGVEQFHQVDAWVKETD